VDSAAKILATPGDTSGVFHILLRVTWDWSYVQWFFLYVVMHLFFKKTASYHQKVRWNGNFRI